MKDNKKALEYSLAQVKLLNELCDPLFKTFGLTTFGYKKVRSDGRYLFLSSNKQWLEFHYHNVGGHGKFFKSVMDLCQKTGFNRATWPKEAEDDFLQALFGHHMSNGINFYKAKGDGIDMWTFSTDSDHYSNPNDYIPILNCLEKFIEYFRSCTPTMVTEFDEKNYAHLIGNIGKEIQFTAPQASVVTKVNDFMKVLDKREFFIEKDNQVLKLTRRQYDCLKALCHGKTVKEAARDLGISPKTVEEHIDKIKQKGGFVTRSEIICHYYKSLLNQSF